jgi:hypothetical protein
VHSSPTPVLVRHNRVRHGARRRDRAAELFGTPVSEGTVATMTRRAADGLSELAGVAETAPADSQSCWANSWSPRPSQFCAIRSYLSTAAKHGKHLFEVLVTLTESRPWMPAIQ